MGRWGVRYDARSRCSLVSGTFWWHTFLVALYFWPRLTPPQPKNSSTQYSTPPPPQPARQWCARAICLACWGKPPFYFFLFPGLWVQFSGRAKRLHDRLVSAFRLAQTALYWGTPKTVPGRVFSMYQLCWLGRNWVGKRIIQDVLRFTNYEEYGLCSPLLTVSSLMTRGSHYPEYTEYLILDAGKLRWLLGWVRSWGRKTYNNSIPKPWKVAIQRPINPIQEQLAKNIG